MVVVVVVVVVRFSSKDAGSSRKNAYILTSTHGNLGSLDGRAAG